MVLLVELLIGVGILVAVAWLALGRGDRLAAVEPDRRPTDRSDGPLTADQLVAVRLPLGLGYRKIDVDRLLDRLARQLPREGALPSSEGMSSEVSSSEPRSSEPTSAEPPPVGPPTPGGAPATAEAAANGSHARPVRPADQLGAERADVPVGTDGDPVRMERRAGGEEPGG